MELRINQAGRIGFSEEIPRIIKKDNIERPTILTIDIAPIEFYMPLIPPSNYTAEEEKKIGTGNGDPEILKLFIWEICLRGEEVLIYNETEHDIELDFCTEGLWRLDKDPDGRKSKEILQTIISLAQKNKSVKELILICNKYSREIKRKEDLDDL
jgi:hypothetical protein